MKSICNILQGLQKDCSWIYWKFLENKLNKCKSKWPDSFWIHSKVSDREGMEMEGKGVGVEEGLEFQGFLNRKQKQFHKK